MKKPMFSGFSRMTSSAHRLVPDQQEFDLASSQEDPNFGPPELLEALNVSDDEPKAQDAPGKAGNEDQLLDLQEIDVGKVEDLQNVLIDDDVDDVPILSSSTSPSKFAFAKRCRERTEVRSNKGGAGDSVIVGR